MFRDDFLPQAVIAVQISNANEQLFGHILLFASLIDRKKLLPSYQARKVGNQHLVIQPFALDEQIKYGNIPTVDFEHTDETSEVIRLSATTAKGPRRSR